MSELLKINVNEHTEKKNGLTYLSWAWAWAEVLKIDSEATWEAHEYNGLPCIVLPDTSCMVKVSVTIHGKTKSCLLPVMNHRNQAIKGPDAFAINTAIVRCLTKAISMHGLGLYIYAGEDLPEQDEQQQAPARLVVPDGGKPLTGAEDNVPDDEKPYLKELSADLKDMASQGKPRHEIFDRYEIENLNDDQKKYLWTLLPAPVKRLIKEEGEARRKQAA